MSQSGAVSPPVDILEASLIFKLNVQVPSASADSDEPVLKL